MDILSLTTSEAIRGLLGVELLELPEQTFTDVALASRLQYDIEGWLSDPIATVVAEGVDVGATAAEVRRYNGLRFYAQCMGGILIFPHLRLGKAEEISDGQNLFKRSKQAMKDLLEDLHGMADGYRAELLVMQGETASAMPIISGTSPTYDPVTNEES